jgi:hypothetical protein
MAEKRKISPAIVSFLLCLLVFLACLIIYLPALKVGWNSDDFAYSAFFTLTFERLVHVVKMVYAGEVEWTFLRPVGYLLWRIDYIVWGENPVGFHLTNILLHCTNAVLLFALLRAMGLNRISSTASALFFGLYPAAVEPVVWLSGRFDVFSLTCLLAAFVLWFHGRLGNRTWLLVLSLIAFTLAILTKETAFMGVLLLPLFDWLIHTRSKREFGTGRSMAWRWYLGWIAVIAAFVLVRYILFRDIGGYVSTSNRNTLFQSDFEQAWFNLTQRDLWILITPLHRDLFSEYPPSLQNAYIWFGIIASAGIVSALAYSFAAAFKGDMSFIVRFLIGIIWAILFAIPSVTLMGVKDNLDFSRYIYLSAAGLALMVGNSLSIAQLDGRIIKILTAILVLIMLSLSSFALMRHAGVWLEASHYTQDAYVMLENYTNDLPDDSDIFIINMPTDWKGAHFAPVGYHLYLEYKYGVRRAKVHYLIWPENEIRRRWENIGANWKRPAVGFEWATDRNKLLLLPPIGARRIMPDSVD